MPLSIHALCPRLSHWWTPGWCLSRLMRAASQPRALSSCRTLQQVDVFKHTRISSSSLFSATWFARWTKKSLPWLRHPCSHCFVYWNAQPCRKVSPSLLHHDQTGRRGDSVSHMTQWYSGTMSCHDDSLLPSGYPLSPSWLGRMMVCGTFLLLCMHAQTHAHTHARTRVCTHAHTLWMI